MTDIQNIYSILQARGYQETLFSRLTGARKKEGREIRVDCPICHSEGNFSYSTEKPLWKCWSCGAGGDWLDFMQKVEGQGFQIALQELASVAGVELSPHSQEAYRTYTRKADILEEAQELFKKGMENQIRNDGAVIVYLTERGYSIQEVMDMELGAYTSRKDLQEYLKGKGYTEKEIKDSGLLSSGFGEDYQLAFLWRDASGRAIGMVGRLIISEDELKIQGLSKYKYSYGMQKDQGLIGFTSARGSERIILLEGVLDALYLNSKGFKSVAVGGTSLSATQLQALQQAGCKELLLAMDMDEAGQRATEKIIRNLSSSSLRAYVISLPEGYKDPDVLVRGEGEEAFQEAIKQAESWASWLARRIISRHDISTDRGVDSALEEAVEAYTQIDDAILAKRFRESLEESTGLTEEDLAGRLDQAYQTASSKKSQAVLESRIQEIQKKTQAGDLAGAEAEMDKALREVRINRGIEAPEPYLLEDLSEDILSSPEALSTGWSSLDKLAKIPAGALTIIAGRPGQGKTTFQLNLLSNLLRDYPDKNFYYFSYEEARKAIALKLIMMRAGVVIQAESNYGAYVHYMKARRGSVEASDRRIEQALQEFKELTSAGRLTISDDMYPADDLATVIGLLAKKGNTGAVIVDYIQRIPTQSQSQRYLELKIVSSRLLEQAVKLDIPIILGAQLNRSQDSTKPRLENLRESGDIEQDANLVLSLYTPAIEGLEMAESKGYVSAVVDMEVSILKNRGGASGRKITLSFNRPVLSISEKAGGRF
jgi:DNA primase catalytic core